MSIHWISGKLGAAGLSAAVIAVAATPEASQPPSGVATVRAADRTRVRATSVAPAPVALQLDMARLRRLQPVTEELAAPLPTPQPVVETAPDVVIAVEEKAVAQEASAKPEIVDAFATRTWYVPPPPPPPVKPEPPPKPTAPPLPFAYMGRYEDAETPPIVMLVRGDRLYTVSAGDSIDDTYRVDLVENGRVELTYLPLQQKQVLQTGEPG
jgi:hypothetical protein